VPRASAASPQSAADRTRRAGARGGRPSEGPIWQKHDTQRIGVALCLMHPGIYPTPRMATTVYHRDGRVANVVGSKPVPSPPAGQSTQIRQNEHCCSANIMNRDDCVVPRPQPMGNAGAP
jgi:hypothetical protein